MSTFKTALLSLLIACWLAGLLSQFHNLSAALFYLLLSMLIVVGIAAKRRAQMRYAKNPPSRPR